VANPESNFKGNPCFGLIICCFDLKENYMIKNFVEIYPLRTRVKKVNFGNFLAIIVAVWVKWLALRLYLQILLMNKQVSKSFDYPDKSSSSSCKFLARWSATEDSRFEAKFLLKFLGLLKMRVKRNFMV